MKAARQIAKLRERLADAEATLRALRAGEVDALVVAGQHGPQVFTLEGAEHAYRVLMESMNEGALTLTARGTILYANQCFARMAKCPLEQVIGSSFRRLLSAEDRAALQPLLKRVPKSGAKIQVRLKAGDGSQVPAQISVRSLAKHGDDRATVGMVITDMKEALRDQEVLRALTRRVVSAQESERGRVALELHDNITQLLCAIVVRYHALAGKFPARDGPLKAEAMKLGELLAKAAEEVERISRHLRPSVLDQMGLVAVLRRASREFEDRTGVSVELACVPLTVGLPADADLTLYRILQETLTNVEKHAHARHVTVRLTKQGDFAQLAINDDGIGFEPDHHLARRKRKGGLGLLSMHERATYVGGALEVISALGKGTTIRVRIPLVLKRMRARGGAR